MLILIQPINHFYSKRKLTGNRISILKTEFSTYSWQSALLITEYKATILHHNLVILIKHAMYLAVKCPLADYLCYMVVVEEATLLGIRFYPTCIIIVNSQPLLPAPKLYRYSNTTIRKS